MPPALRYFRGKGSNLNPVCHSHIVSNPKDRMEAKMATEASNVEEGEKQRKYTYVVLVVDP